MREAAEMYEHLDQPVAAVRPLCDLASTMVFLGDEAEAERIGMRALEVARSASLSWGHGYALHMVGQLRLAQQRYTDVVDFADEAVPIWLKLGDARGLAHELLSKAIALRHLGDSREANRVAREALRHFNELGELWGQFGALLSLAASHAALGQVELAARLTGAAEAFSQTIGAVPIPVWQTEWDFARDTVCVSLGPRQSESNFAIGHATSIGQAIALAIASEPAEPRAALPDGVTPREAEVLQLLAQRYSNREIADALVLSIRTVERHISNIYLKTGISSRREAANYLKRGNDFFSE
jgi:DNA-binding CsgD family transcriptional regulator